MWWMTKSLPVKVWPFFGNAMNVALGSCSAPLFMLVILLSEEMLQDILEDEHDEWQQ